MVLDTEQLSFKVRAQDDFGIKHVGLDWQGIESPVEGKPAKGERILCRRRQRERLARDRGDVLGQVAGDRAAAGRTCGSSWKTISPGRGRVYSPTYTFYVLNAEQHAIWVTEQLSKWHRQSLLVRDREMQLFETNKQLRELDRRRARPAGEPATGSRTRRRPSGPTAGSSRAWSFRART